MKLKTTTTGKRRVLNAFDRLLTQGVKIITQDMQRSCAVAFYQLVFKNIVEQKFSTPWDYHPRYKAWKTETVKMGENFWVLRGDLLQSLSAFPFKSGWMGGIPAGILDSGGKSWLGEFNKGKPKYIAYYARILEFGSQKGGQKHPERPVFRPTATEFAREYWRKEGQKALLRIRKIWR